jgi:hypothetical protein
MLRSLAEGQKEVPRNESVSFMRFWFDLFPVQANKQSDLLAVCMKVLCIQTPVVNLLITFTVTI